MHTHHHHEQTRRTTSHEVRAHRPAPRRWLTVVTMAAFAACNAEEGSVDSGIDSAVDSGRDSAVDSGIDSGLDGGRDGAVDSGADGADVTCAQLGTASWVGTEDVAIRTGSCSQYTNLAVTFQIAQAAGGCTFSMTNSRVSGVTFAGTVRGDRVSWTAAPYAYLGGTLTLDAVDGQLSSDRRTLSGSFSWTLAGPIACTGVTGFTVAKQ